MMIIALKSKAERIKTKKGIAFVKCLNSCFFTRKFIFIMPFNARILLFIVAKKCNLIKVYLNKKRYNFMFKQKIQRSKDLQRTLSIIKPDAVEKGVIGKILDRFESNGLNIVAMKKMRLTEEQAQQFYAVHKERPFFKDLVKFMISGPVVVLVLEGKEAVSKNRELMGATNPSEAKEGTIRRDFATSIDANAVHGSDSLENAAIEIEFFFSGDELLKE